MTATITLDRAHCIDTIVKSSHLKNFEMDKAAESAMLQAFNSIVPRGTYLADFLEGAAECFESAMLSDMVMPIASNVRAVRQELAETQKELAALKQKVKDEEEKLRKTRREADYAKRQVIEMGDHLRSIDDNMIALRRSIRELKAE